MAQSFSAGAELLTGEAQSLVRAADALQYAVDSIDADTTAIAHGRSGPPLEVWLSLWDQRLSAWTEVIAGIREAANRVASIAAAYADTSVGVTMIF